MLEEIESPVVSQVMINLHEDGTCSVYWSNITPVVFYGLLALAGQYFREESSEPV